MAKKRKKTHTAKDSLNRAKVPRVRAEFIDYDYKDKLNEKEFEWLAKFNSEFYGASVGYDEETGRAKKGQLHKKKTQIKEIFDDNNRRNNDVLGVTRVNALLTNVEGEIKKKDGWWVSDPERTEHALNASLDTDEDVLLTFEEYEKVKHNLTFEMQIFYEAYFSEDLDVDWVEDET